MPRDGGGAGPAEGALVPGGRSAGSCGGGGAGPAEGARVPAGGAWPGIGFRRKSQFLQSGYRKPATAMAPDGQGLALRLVLVGAPRQQEACHWGPCTFAAHVLSGRRPGGGLRAGAQTELFLPRPHLRPVLSGKLTTQTRLILAWTTSATSSRWDDPA